jgi:hypothetical protein
VAAEPAVSLDYAALVRADDLKRPPEVRPDATLRLIIAALVGGVRLIDNLDPFTSSPDAGGGPSLLTISASPAKGIN